LESGNRIYLILLSTITVLIISPILVIWFSRWWYQSQSKSQTIDDVIFIGKNHPSPILTLLFRFYKSLLNGLEILKKGIKTGVLGLIKLLLFLGLRINNLFIHDLPLLLKSGYRKLTEIFLRIKGMLIRTGKTVWKYIQIVAGAIAASAKFTYTYVRSKVELVTLAIQSLLKIKKEPDQIRKPRLSSIFEIFIIILWAIFVGRDCLNFAPDRVLYGIEFPLVVQSHFAWTVLQKCGDCMLWNGFINGGAPAFVDTHGAVLHPLVVITTLALGVANGAQLVLIFSLALAGIAQWWLARVMGLGRFTRMWVAFLVVVGGHLAGKMENGNVMLMLSTASASFVLAPMFDLMHTRSRSSLIWSGIALGLLFVSGQGYIQVGMALAILPVFSLFLFNRKLHLKPVWKDVASAFLLGFLLAGVFLVPLLHFLPNTYKDIDPEMLHYQPLEYLPLNLVIHDHKFFYTNVLGRDTNLYMNYIYIGWIPVLLALLAIPLFWRKNLGKVLFFISSIAFVFFLSSKEFANLIIMIIPQYASIRWGSIMSGLSVPLVIGLSSLSFDHFYHSKWWPKFEFGISGFKKYTFSLSYLLIIPLSAASISTLYQQNRGWLTTYSFRLDGDVVKEMTTPSSQWIQPDIHNYLWTRELLEKEFKLSGIWRPWFWKDHDSPLPYKSFETPADNSDHKDVYAVYGEYEVMVHDENLYSYISSDGHVTECPSNATGGVIKTTCQSDEAGYLVVEENQWEGWTATMDGSPVMLIPGRFLSVQAPAGFHTYEFRYKPWDVWVGLGVTILGIVFALYLRFWAPKEL